MPRLASCTNNDHHVEVEHCRKSRRSVEHSIDMLHSVCRTAVVMCRRSSPSVALKQFVSHSPCVRVSHLMYPVLMMRMHFDSRHRYGSYYPKPMRLPACGHESRRCPRRSSDSAPHHQNNSSSHDEGIPGLSSDGKQAGKYIRERRRFGAEDSHFRTENRMLWIVLGCL